MYILLYLLLCVLVGWLGRKKAIGFVGFFLVAFLLTPIITFVILLATSDRVDGNAVAKKY